MLRRFHEPTRRNLIRVKCQTHAPLVKDAVDRRKEEIGNDLDATVEGNLSFRRSRYARHS